MKTPPPAKPYHTVFLGHVGLNAVGAVLIRSVLHGQIRDDRIGTAANKLRRNRFTDSGCPSGDNNRFPGQFQPIFRHMYFLPLI